jgi:acyl-CoA dehydrogenase
MSILKENDYDVSMSLGRDYPELRDAVKRICAQFPGSYWRELERDSNYPTAFIEALTKAGFLAS